MKTKERAKSYILRKEGRSLGEIATILNVSKSTASLWTSGVVLDEKGRQRIESLRILSREKGHAILHEMKLQRIKKAEDEANLLLKRVMTDKNKELIALAMMYWCEGNKSDNKVGFTNSDPDVARLL